MNKMKKIYLGIATVALVGVGIGVGDFAYSMFKNPQSEFIRNQIKQYDAFNSYLDERMKLTNDYGKKACDKNQKLEFKVDNGIAKSDLEVYYSNKDHKSSIFGSVDLLGTKLTGGIVEKDNKVNVDFSFFNKIIEIPNDVINNVIKENSNGEIKNVKFSLNEFVKSFFFTSKSEGYKLSDSQLKKIYKSINKDAFSKNDRTITLKLNRDNLTKLITTFSDEVKKNIKDSQLTISMLNNLVKEVKAYDGELIIDQVTMSDDTLVYHFKSNIDKLKANVTSVDSTANKDWISLSVDNNRTSVKFTSDKNGGRFKETIKVSDRINNRDNLNFVMTSDKVNDNEYKIEGKVKTNDFGVEREQDILGYIKTFDKSLEFKIGLDTNSVFGRYTYDVDFKDINVGNKKKVVVNDFKGAEFTKLMEELQASFMTNAMNMKM